MICQALKHVQSPLKGSHIVTFLYLVVLVQVFRFCEGVGVNCVGNSDCETLGNSTRRYECRNGYCMLITNGSQVSCIINKQCQPTEVCVWNVCTLKTSETTASDSSSQRLPGWAIALIVIGCTALVASVACLAIQKLKRPSKNNSRVAKSTTFPAGFLPPQEPVPVQSLAIANDDGPFTASTDEAASSYSQEISKSQTSKSLKETDGARSRMSVSPALAESPSFLPYSPTPNLGSNWGDKASPKNSAKWMTPLPQVAALKAANPTPPPSPLSMQGTYTNAAFVKQLQLNNQIHTALARDQESKAPWSSYRVSYPLPPADSLHYDGTSYSEEEIVSEHVQKKLDQYRRAFV